MKIKDSFNDTAFCAVIPCSLVDEEHPPPSSVFLLKEWYISPTLHGVITHKAVIFTFTASRTSDLASRALHFILPQKMTNVY
jgi:hypothetical protein